ncbi:MAG: sulfotransferase family protein [Panacagrimonas sp.]
MRPNFLVIGTYRAGTTWLHEVLRQHPQVFLPAEKELMFFNRHYDRGIDWYERLYADWKGQKVVGEICPTYLSFEPAAARIAKDLPGARLVAILRKPSEQVASHYQLRRSRGILKGSLEQEIERDPVLLDTVQYHRHLERFCDAVGPERVTILFYDDLMGSPKDFLDGIYALLGIDPFYPASMEMKENASRVPRIKLVEKLINVPAAALRKRGMLKTKALLKQMGVVQALRRFNTHAPKRNGVSEEVLARVAERTAADRLKLGAMTGRDLSGWL